MSFNTFRTLWHPVTRRATSGRPYPEAGRYHIFYSYACPWACRTVALLGIKGLGDVITTSSVHPCW